MIDIETDESMEEIYRGIAHYMTYHGVYLHRWEVRDRYYQIMKQQKDLCSEECPEIDVEAIWNTLLMREGIKAASARRRLALILAHIYRGISRKRLQLYPNVKKALDIMKLMPSEVICVGNDMYRDIYGANRLGIKTIFVDSNQGDKYHENVTPDYFAHRFEDVLKGVEALR